MHTILVGGQWGDEGKGKCIDALAPKYQIVARYGGGANAGHTVIVGKHKTVLHLLPSGILHSHMINVIGNGVVLDPLQLFKEIEELATQGVAVTPKNLKISDRCHVIMPWHLKLDELNEQSSGAVGSTKRGIMPAYREKTARTGITAGEFVDLGFERKLPQILDRENQEIIHAGGQPLTLNDCQHHFAFAAKLRPFVIDTGLFLDQYNEKSVLYEGAQGTLLDVDHGTYPFVTSSTTISGGACAGLGIPPTRINDVYGIVKAYVTRVGKGPFPTELLDATGEQLRQIGHEFGATTGRPRRCGWMDLVALRYASRINGFTGMVITKLDVLDSLDRIQVCVAYEYEGKRITDFPASLHVLEHCIPIYETVQGWKQPTSSCRAWNDLPDQAKDYLRLLEQEAGAKIIMVGVGPEREETIVVA
ncbi:adenylosuccinate synthase [Candidatus Woesearchaeota archaeon]|nr:adenylosuccinate synthase [Candidatus Woesearchaeota archaeon]